MVEVRKALHFVASALIAGACGMACAQSFPAKPVRIIVAYPPGGATDIVARAIAPKAQEVLGQPVLIENQGGAGGKIGTQAVARAAPDGYTILLTVTGSHILSLFEKDVSYNPLKDFTPITQAVETVLCIASNPAVGPKTMQELVDYAKKNPGKLPYGTTGSETMLAMEQIALLSKTKFLFIPYKGGAQATTDLLAGQVPLVLQPVVTFLPHVKSGKLKVLAVMLPKRWDEMPDVPTIQEVVPGFEKAPGGIGIWGPAGLPAAIASRWQQALAAGLKSPEVADKLKAQGMIPIANTPQEFTQAINAGVAINDRLVKSAGVSLN
jgi:tripartite-type tricarboxylate transporter receptor subunit TctC